LIVRALLGVDNLWILAQLLVFHVERERAVLEQRAASQQHIVVNPVSSANSDFDSTIGRTQVVAGLRCGIYGQNNRGHK
jgi:hypothetical protein